MKKLLLGIVDLKKNLSEEDDTYRKLAFSQNPDTFFVACSDSRVVPNLFASTEPGDLFVLRNVGNFVPPYDPANIIGGDRSAAAALEYAVLNLKVKAVVICGHSQCGAMGALCSDIQRSTSHFLQNWLKNGDESLKRLETDQFKDSNLAEHDRLSQLNVLQQMDHIKSYPYVKDLIDNGSLSVHGWWFDIKNAEVYAYSTDESAFVLIDEDKANEIIEKIAED